ncbi:PITH domain-containing protein [Lasiosphaeris hirsuta]|uniref:PITH domain-containing protein n=1 Tax=Lasiosphaeris hirsuta TaxID=260670 RepID=A0AA40BBI5_9PEZI|nr:PITH domain-containing protein [Lasiosphaeris hirsuta]
MSKTVSISSPSQFKELLQSSKIVVADFYADWCGPCNQVAPIYEQLSQALSRPNIVTFTKINTDIQKEIASEYAVTSLPTFIFFRNGQISEKVQGANPLKLRDIVRKLSDEVDSISAAEAAAGSSSSGGGPSWRGAELPRGYADISSQVELQRCELLNVDLDIGNLRVLFDSSKPSALPGGKSGAKDWVESDTDEQLMLFMPFQSMLKLHTLQITSLPPADDDDEDDAPMRPRKIKLFTNKPHNLGFDEAEDMAATQTLELSEKDWNADGTANIALRYVKFQNITSLVMFVVDGDGDGEKVRLDRLRLIGEAGEKREMGKLEKIGDAPGE